MVVVMIVTALSMIFVTTSVAMSTRNVAPSHRSADTLAALAAAHAGVDALVVELATPGCGRELLSGCGLFDVAPHLFGGADDPQRASYAWRVLTREHDFLRVAVTGAVDKESRTLVVDFEAPRDPLEYAHFTEIETLSPAVIGTYYGARTVDLPTASTVARADLLVPPRTSVSWSTAQGTGICDRPWFDVGSTAGRSQLRGLSALGSGQDYTATTSPVLPSGPRKAPCEVSYGTRFQTAGNARVYTNDAPLVSRTYPGGPGPQLGAEVVTLWDTTDSPPPAPPKWYRSDAVLGGDPRVGSFTPTPASARLQLPQPVDGLEGTAACVFTGPTRIVLAGAVARVTSPGTTSLKAGCTATQDATLSGNPGLRNAPIPLTGGTSFYVKDGASTGTAGAANLLFNLRGRASAAQVPGADPAQPTSFYAEMETTQLALETAVAAGASTDPLPALLEAWLQTLNAAPQPQHNPPAQKAQYRVRANTLVAVAGAPFDGLLEGTNGERVTVERGVCNVNNPVNGCGIGGSWIPAKTSDAFTVTRPRSSFPLAADVTTYTNGLGNAFVEGTVSLPLTIAAQNDVVVTGSLASTGSGSVPGLVAGHGGGQGDDVEIYHPVGCSYVPPVPPSVPMANPGRTCPNDITGLYSTAIPSTDAAHPSRQYANLREDNPAAPSLSAISLQAAVLAHNGCFCVQNFMRGPPLGTITMKGAVYQRHRGALSSDDGATSTARPGYAFTLTYDPKVYTTPPPSFTKPTAAAGAAAWPLVGVAERQGSG